MLLPCLVGKLRSLRPLLRPAPVKAPHAGYSRHPHEMAGGGGIKAQKELRCQSRAVLRVRLLAKACLRGAGKGPGDVLEGCLEEAIWAEKFTDQEIRGLWAYKGLGAGNPCIRGPDPVFCCGSNVHGGGVY